MQVEWTVLVNAKLGYEKLDARDWSYILSMGQEVTGYSAQWADKCHCFLSLLGPKMHLHVLLVHPRLQEASRYRPHKSSEST